MSDQNVYSYDGGGQPPQAPAGRSPAAPYKFSPDELRVLKECNNESFFQRSLPLGTLLGLGAFFGVQQGHFKPNPRFGAFPKVTIAVIMGYFLGKISYQQACAEKLMALPGSYIGQLLRERKEGKFDSTRTPPPTTMFGASSSDIYSDAGPGSSLDLDTDRPLFTEDSFVPGSDFGARAAATAAAEAGAEAARSAAPSYDELRRRNRGQYNDSRQDPYRVEPSPAPVVTRAPPASSPPTNKYGDSME